VTPGLITCLVALAAAAGIGAIWRSRNGTMRAPRPSTAARGDGGAATGQPGQRKPAAARRLTSADIGQPLGARATLLQFSSAFCAPCRATRRILADVDLVRDLGVLRTPTVFVLGPGGEIARRASGQPRRPDVIAALGTAILKPDDSYTSGRESG
jgi:hypothetical protein